MNGYKAGCTQYFNRDRIRKQEDEGEKLKEEIQILKNNQEKAM